MWIWIFSILNLSNSQYTHLQSRVNNNTQFTGLLQWLNEVTFMVPNLWHLLLLWLLICWRADQTENREKKMLVLYKTVKIPLSQHGLGELPESMETFRVCLCCRYFSLGPHEATQYLECAYCHWGIAFLILFYFIASGIALGSAGRRLNVSKDWRDIRLPPEKGVSSPGAWQEVCTHTFLFF